MPVRPHDEPYIYVDGELDATQNVGVVVAYTGPAPLMIASTMNTNHHNKGVFNGPIDEVRIYSRALSENEVHDLYLVPVPSAFLLGSIGIGFTGWLCRRKKLQTTGYSEKILSVTTFLENAGERVPTHDYLVWRASS